MKLKSTCDTIAMLRFVEMYKDDTLISITKAAQILNVHPETLRRWDKSNKLQATRIGSRGHRKYSMSKIQALLENPTNKEDIKPLRQLPLSPDMLGSFHEVDSFPVSNIPVGATIRELEPRGYFRLRTCSYLGVFCRWYSYKAISGFIRGLIACPKTIAPPAGPA